jgi:hypothetical protein
MKIYIAARFETRGNLRPYRDQLWELGHEVVSTWLDEVKQPPTMSQDIFWKKLALKDLAEIKAADLLVLDTFIGSERGGKEVEFGFALGQFQSKLVYIVGPIINVFHSLCDRQFDSWPEFIAAMHSDATPGPPSSAG